MTNNPYDIHSHQLADEHRAINENAQRLKEIRNSEEVEILVWEPYINTEKEGFKTRCQIELELSGKNPTQEFVDQLEGILLQARGILANDQKGA